MKYFKIENISREPIKFICKINDNTIGIVLGIDQLCIVNQQDTKFLDAQERRKFITIDRDFNNDFYNFELGKNYNISELKSKIQLAEENAKQYINKK